MPSMPSVFGPRSTTLIHIIEAVLLVAVLAVSVARIAMNGFKIRSRADSMALAMAAKSVAFLSYQILSQHTRYFRKWASLKAYLIINATEIVFWAAVVFLTIQSAIQVCVAPTCAVTWVIVVLGILMSLLSTYATIVAYNNFKAAKNIEQTSTVLTSMDQSSYHRHTDSSTPIHKVMV